MTFEEAVQSLDWTDEARQYIDKVLYSIQDSKDLKNRLHRLAELTVTETLTNPKTDPITSIYASLVSALILGVRIGQLLAPTSIKDASHA